MWFILLAFIDESGKPHPNDNTMNPVLCCVCIREADIKRLSQSIFNIKTKIYGKDTEIKATSLVRRQVLTKRMTNNKQFVEEFVKSACSIDMKVFAIVMDKPDVPVVLRETLLPKHYMLLIKRIEYYCENYGHEKAILIFDEISPRDDLIVAKCITNFLYMSKLGKGFDRILEMPFFVSSEVTPAIQVSDIFASIIRHYYECGLDTRKPEEIKDPFESWIYGMFTQIVSRTENLRQASTGFIEYGFYNMGKRF